LIEHPNVARVRSLFTAFRDHDVATVLDVLAEDVVWRFPGKRGVIAGEHRGRDAVLAFLLQVPALTDGTFRLELEHAIADDERAAVFFRGRGERNGKTLDNPTCLKIRLRERRIVEVDEFVWDLFAVDEFWS
jgi:uncharacterized protein